MTEISAVPAYNPNVLAGIELMHMIRKGQMITPEGADLSFADQFYALAA